MYLSHFLRSTQSGFATCILKNLLYTLAIAFCKDCINLYIQHEEICMAVFLHLCLCEYYHSFKSLLVQRLTCFLDVLMIFFFDSKKMQINSQLMFLAQFSIGFPTIMFYFFIVLHYVVKSQLILPTLLFIMFLIFDNFK